jgi:hypothetical protein
MLMHTNKNISSPLFSLPETDHLHKKILATAIGCLTIMAIAIPVSAQVGSASLGGIIETRDLPRW